MEILKKIKKRNIAAILTVALRVFVAFKPEAFTPEQIETIRWAIDTLLVVGFANSVGRTETVQNLFKKTPKQ